MIALLTIILAIELFFFFYSNGKRIVSPSFLATLVFLMSSLLYLIYKDSFFGVDISWMTVILIPIYLLCIYIGEIIALRVYVFPSKCSENHLENQKEIRISNLIILIATIFTIVASLLYFIDVYKYSLRLGNSAYNFWNMAEIVRRDNTYSTPSYISLLNILAECIVYLFIYIFVYNVNFKGRRQVKLLIPCLGYLIYIFACHSRGNIIRNLSIICIIVFCLISQKHNWKAKSNKKILIIGCLCVLAFFIVFRILGYRTGTSENLSFMNNIVDYMSSGLLGFDIFINEPIQSNELFGVNTFKMIYLKLNDFGFNFDIGAQFDDFFTFKGYQSNIYTGLKGLISDFGFVGCGLFLSLYSFMVAKLIKRIKNNGSNLFRCAILGLLFYPFLMLSIGAEWPNVFSITTIYTIIVLLVLNMIINKKSYKTHSVDIRVRTV